VPPAEGGGEPPVVLFSQGELRNRANSDKSILFFDSGATHHIVYDERYLRNLRTSSITKIELGGGECHYVMGEGASVSVILSALLPTLNTSNYAE
jgi:hypothetical protein